MREQLFLVLALSLLFVAFAPAQDAAQQANQLAKEGQFKPPNATVLIPVVGLLGLLRHGEAVNIKKGTPFTAYLAQDSLLEPID
ncbi:MAG TPA: hypothetical protein VNK47_00190 [Candidatus Dormibacteraeota bacterium]|jgi:hypothetical protein|nr:hypothetical protein [Candidatus Dormibacteraeota bacterium]